MERITGFDGQYVYAMTDVIADLLKLEKRDLQPHGYTLFASFDFYNLDESKIRSADTVFYFDISEYNTAHTFTMSVLNERIPLSAFGTILEKYSTLKPDAFIVLFRTSYVQFMADLAPLIRKYAKIKDAGQIDKTPYPALPTWNEIEKKGIADWEFGGLKEIEFIFDRYFHTDFGYKFNALNDSNKVKFGMIKYNIPIQKKQNSRLFIYTTRSTDDKYKAQGYPFQYNVAVSFSNYNYMEDFSLVVGNDFETLEQAYAHLLEVYEKAKRLFYQLERTTKATIIESLKNNNVNSKHDWQMTFDEYAAANYPKSIVLENDIRGFAKKGDTVHLEVIDKYDKDKVAGKLSTDGVTIRVRGYISGVTTVSFATLGLKHHKTIIFQAIQDGKAVPSEVLADYPDLLCLVYLQSIVKSL
jgi:hypothetical protein